MNLSWFLFLGRKLGMDKQEIYWCPIGEMLDMLACLSIFEGGAKQKKKMTFDEVLKLE